MTARERLLAVLRKQSVDRVPIWLLFPFHPTVYYADVRSNPCYKEVFEASRRYAVHLDRRNFSLDRFSSEVEHREAEWTVGSKRYRRSTLAYKGRTLTEEPGVQKLLSNAEDLEFFCSLPINLDVPAIERQLAAQMSRYRIECAEFPLELGAMMLDLGEPIGLLYGASNLLEYPVWSLTHAELIGSFLTRMQANYLAEYRYMLDRDAADVYFLVGSELASPPLVSPQTFRRWIVPFVRELVDLIHGYGKLVIQHYHGQVREILSDFLTMGPDAIHTIEAPPVGNCTLTEAFDIVGDRMALIGNIQYDDFRGYTQERMREAVREALQEAEGHRLILSPTAGPYEETIGDNMVKNYIAFMKAGWEYGTRTHGKETT
jgi:hypothetical protein